MYIGHTIKEWEQAIEHRSDVEFMQINLQNGRVDTVIGTILQPCKRKYRGQIHYRSRKVRLNCFGICQSLYGDSKDDLSGYNINLI